MPAEIEKLLEQSVVLYNEAKSLLLNDNCTAEDMVKADKIRNDADGLKARASQLKKIELAKDTAVDPNPAQPVPKADGEFKNWRELVKAVTVWHLTKGREMDPRLKFYDAVKGLSGSTGSTGGFLLGTQTLPEIMAVAGPMAVVRPNATQIPMSERSVRFTKLNQKGATAGQANFYGGVQVYWQEEGAQITESQPGFIDGELIARELVGYTAVNNSLLADVPALSAFLGSRLGFPGAIAWAEDYAFLRGNGVGKPLGILNSPVLKTIADRATDNDITFPDLAGMMGAFMGEDPIWIASQSAMAKMLQMNGPSGNASYLWGSAKDGVPDTLLGRPIKFVDKLPAIGTSGDIMLCDFAYYLVGTLTNGTSLEPSEHHLFRNNQTAFRIIHRIDGQPWLDKPITLQDGTTELSPFVALPA